MFKSRMPSAFSLVAPLLLQFLGDGDFFALCEAYDDDDLWIWVIE